MSVFICDDVRLILVGNARAHEIEGPIDEEIETIKRDKLTAYQTLTAVSDGLPALGFAAAVPGIIKAMGALDQSPELLGELIGAALVDTFAGIFMSDGIAGPLAHTIKVTREKRNRLYVIIKQPLLAFMNGAPPRQGPGPDRAEIRQIAERHAIPVIEDKALARSMYDHVQVSRFIPADFHEAVAELILSCNRATSAERHPP